MSEARLYDWLIWLWFAVAALTFVSLFFKTAPYGRHQKKTLGPAIPSWLGWMLMEAPSPLVMLVCFLVSPPLLPGAYIFLGLWLVHYTNRSFIYPLRNPGRHKPMPLFICGSAIFFNLVNGYLNGRGLTRVGSAYEWSWFIQPRTVAGLALWACGWAINLQADAILFRLRRPGESGYKIPRGGLYDLVSCPNYLGEIVEWLGFAVAVWSPAAWSFAAWTAANLAPRALAHHRWYRSQFSDYPSQRRALIPYVI